MRQVLSFRLRLAVVLAALCDACWNETAVRVGGKWLD